METPPAKRRRLSTPRDTDHEEMNPTLPPTLLPSLSTLWSPGPGEINPMVPPTPPSLSTLWSPSPGKMNPMVPPTPPPSLSSLWSSVPEEINLLMVPPISPPSLSPCSPVPKEMNPLMVPPISPPSLSTSCSPGPREFNPLMVPPISPPSLSTLCSPMNPIMIPPISPPSLTNQRSPGSQLTDPSNRRTIPLSVPSPSVSHHKQSRTGLGMNFTFPGKGPTQKDIKEAISKAFQLFVQLLAHSHQCQNKDCKNPHCAPMKKIILHVLQCTRCGVCKQFISICLNHAKTCKSSSCQVPLCGKLKKHMQEHQRETSAQENQCAGKKLRAIRPKPTTTSSLDRGSEGASMLPQHQADPSNTSPGVVPSSTHPNQGVNFTFPALQDQRERQDSVKEEEEARHIAHYLTRPKPVTTSSLDISSEGAKVQPYPQALPSNTSPAAKVRSDTHSNRGIDAILPGLQDWRERLDALKEKEEARHTAHYIPTNGDFFESTVGTSSQLTMSSVDDTYFNHPSLADVDLFESQFDTSSELIMAITSMQDTDPSHDHPSLTDAELFDSLFGNSYN